MDILITPDINGWAIGNLTHDIVHHNPRFNFHVIPVHPRGAADGARLIKKLFRERQIHFWHAQYWNSAYQVLDLCHELKPLPKLLTHHNHYALHEKDWKEFDALNEMTTWGCDVLKTMHPRVFRIPHGVDLERLSFIEDWNPEEKTVGYVGRVIAHKNLGRISEVTKRLGYKTLATGYVDKPDYWEQVMKGDHLEFHGGFGRDQVPPENFKNELYRRMRVFVMYSTGEIESGTIPLLEAMARGVPVLTTEQGMARDLIKDGVNGVFFNDGNFEEKLKMLMEDRDLQERLRREAWRTIRRYSAERMARDYALAYYRAMWKDMRVLSIIIPTFQRADSLLQTLLSIEEQSYPAKEIIVCDDGSDDETPIVVAEAKKQMVTPILYLKTGERDAYGLAKARNKGAIEALGDTLIFLDDRLRLERGALDVIAQHVEPKVFYYGTKITVDGSPSNKQAFVENFSWINRASFMAAGMCNERMEWYGGMSEEMRIRFGAQNYGFQQVAPAAARENAKTRHGSKKKQMWKAKLLIDKMYEKDRLR